ncbi:MAG TPA: hypothetical protein VH835_10185 [Dongiaceae bacterium]|jgi:hypothetical protein
MGVLAALLLAAASPSFACNCPKETLIKERGTLSADLPDWPVPPAIPPQKAAPPTAG